MSVRRLLAVLALMMLASGAVAFAQDAEPIAIRLAKHDAAKAAERAALTMKAQQDAAAAVATQTATLEASKTAAIAADNALKVAVDALPGAEQARTAADQALAAAQATLKQIETEKPGDVAAIAAATKTAADSAQAAGVATSKFGELLAAKAASTLAKADAAGKIIAAEVALKTATDAKTAADAAVAPREASSKAAADRLAQLTTLGVKPDPTAIREIAKFTHDRPALTCRFDANGDWLLVGNQAHTLQRWDVFAAAKSEIPGHDSWVIHAIPLGDGQRWVTGAYDGKLGLWEVSQPAPKLIDAHQGFLRSMAVSADGKWIATGGNDKEVKVWSAADGSLVQTLSGHGSHIYSLTFHPSGKWLYSGDLMGVIKQWDTSNWQLVRDLDAGPLHKYDAGFAAHVGGVRSMEVSPDGKTLVAAGVGNVSNAFAGIGDPTLIQFDVETGTAAKPVAIPGTNQGSFWAVRWHPSGEFYVLAGWAQPGMLWFFKPGEEKPFHSFKLTANAYDCAWHPDGLRLAVALYDKNVSIYDISPKPPEAAAAPAK